MKRPIIIGLTALTIVGLVGCNKPSDTKVEANDSQSKQEESSNKPSNQKIKTEDLSTYTGKVSNIIGNQVTIKLIEGDFELTDEMKKAMGIIELSESQKQQLEKEGRIELEDGVTYGLTGLGESEEVDLSEDPGLSREDLKEMGIDVEAEEAAEREKKQAIFNQIEFNGESKEFTLQAGVTIRNGLTGYDAKMSDIKKGSIVDMTIDENTNTVIRVQIRF